MKDPHARIFEETLRGSIHNHCYICKKQIINLSDPSSLVKIYISTVYSFMSFIIMHHRYPVRKALPLTDRVSRYDGEKH